MTQNVRTHPGLTGNQLKIIAMIAMTCDHVGLQLAPQAVWLRVIGRLALPIYAYMIAEGCRHTRNRRNYLLRMASLAAMCQIVYLLAMGSLYMCILVTFSLSVILIELLDAADREKTLKSKARLWAGVALAFFICVVLPELWHRSDFAIDYGLTGVLLPVLIYGAGTRGLLVGLTLVALDHGGIQWLAFLAVPLMLAYNGRRGKTNIGRLFYWYYPAHLVVIYGLSLIM